MRPDRPDAGPLAVETEPTHCTSGTAPLPRDPAGTLPDLLRQRIENTPDKIAYRRFDEHAGRWQSFSWADVGILVARWQRALVGEGLAAGGRVGVLLPNGLDWIACDQAALALGLIVVPLYVTDAPSNWAYQLDHAGVQLVVLEHREQWFRIAEQQAVLPTLLRVVVTDVSPSPSVDDILLIPLSRWLPAVAGPITQRTIAPNDLATIIYTSGTTGPAKGVMLTHRNILAAIDSVLDAVPVHPDDIFLSYLPLAHVFERIIGYYLPLVADAEVAFARSVEALREDLLTIQPTVLLGVPRVYERIYAAVHHRFGQYGLTQAILSWAERLGWQDFEATQGRAKPLPLWQRMVWPILRTLVAMPLRARFGGRIRVLVSGGAHLPEKVGHLMVALGLPLLEGYGLTESAAPVSGNALDDNIIGTAGRPLHGVEVRIADNGELMVRAPSVMAGYWRAPELTRAALTEDGWLHTGDLADLRDGRLLIRGRLKELLVTSTGENIGPMPIEEAIILDPLFDQALVVGDGRPFLAAIIVVNGEAWPRFAQRLGLPPDDAEALHAPTTKKAVLARLDQLLTAFPKYAQIRAVHLSPEPWTVNNGLLTTTQKARRHAIETHFSNDIESLYRGHTL